MVLTFLLFLFEVRCPLSPGGGDVRFQYHQNARPAASVAANCELVSINFDDAKYTPANNTSAFPASVGDESGLRDVVAVSCSSFRIIDINLPL